MLEVNQPADKVFACDKVLVRDPLLPTLLAAVIGFALLLTICDKETILGNGELISLGDAGACAWSDGRFNQSINFYNHTITTRHL